MPKLYPLLLAALALACHRNDRSRTRDGVETATSEDTSRVGTADFEDPIDPSTGLEQSCDFAKTFTHPDPRRLLSEFLSRAARGQFSEAEPWLPQAVDCPGHEPGYDMFMIVSSYSSSRIDSIKDTVRFLLSRRMLGFHSDSFRPDARLILDTVIVYRTSYGWRISSPAPWNWISAGDAVARGWLRAADTVLDKARR